jgi:hypothetical protein
MLAIYQELLKLTVEYMPNFVQEYIMSENRVLFLHKSCPLETTMRGHRVGYENVQLILLQIQYNGNYENNSQNMKYRVRLIHS